MESRVFKRVRWMSFVAVAIVVLARVWVGYLGGDADFYIRDEAAKLQSKIERHGMEPVGKSLVERSAWSAKMTWNYEIREDWTSYAKWIKDQLAPAYNIHMLSETRIEFGRQLDGDAHDVVIELITVGPPTVVRVTFTTEAD